MHQGGSLESPASFWENLAKAHSRGTQNPQRCLVLGTADPWLLYFARLGFVFEIGFHVNPSGLEPSKLRMSLNFCPSCLHLP